MNRIIYGFYGHRNMGDDLFQEAFKLLFPDDNLVFRELSNMNKEEIKNYDSVIVGGGDVLNDFYGRKYMEVLHDYAGYKIALGVGISYQSCISEKYINLFDDIVIRNQTDLHSLRPRIGTVHSHYMPDLVFSLPLNNNESKKEDGRRVGLFLVGSFLKNNSFLFSLCMMIYRLISLDYIIDLIPMYLQDDIMDNDYHLNEYIYNTFSHTGKINSLMYNNNEDFFNLIKNLDFAICMRFHAHILCTRFGIPYLSIPITRKVELYQNELPQYTDFSVKMVRRNDYSLIEFSVDEAMKLFRKIVKRKDAIRTRLLNFNKQNEDFFNSGKIQKLLRNKVKRTITPFFLYKISPDQLYEKYRNIFLENGINILKDKPTDLLDLRKIHEIADDLCYEMTLDPSNSYSYGTRINMVEQLSELKNMIYWIYHDMLSKVSPGKINLNYIRQDTFGGLHRAGWQYALDGLYYLNSDYGVLLDSFLDRTFGWASNVLINAGILPYTNHWIGFFHHTFNKDYSLNNCSQIFKSSVFLASLPLCKGLFCLTEYLANQIRKALRKVGFENIKVNVLMHPTIYPPHKFSFKQYVANTNKQLANIGAWYRNPISIYQLSEMILDKNIKCVALKGSKMEGNFCPNHFPVIIRKNKIEHINASVWERYFTYYLNSQVDKFTQSLYYSLMEELEKSNSDNIIINLRNHNSIDLLEEFLSRVEIITNLSNEDYDQFLNCNIVFLYLIDASVANTIIECIVRHVPLIVNKIPPSQELLGNDYPLFYNHLDEIPQLLTDENIQKAHLYLKSLNKRNHDLYRRDTFITSFLSSDIITSL